MTSTPRSTHLLLRWSLLTYSLFALAGSVIYIILNGKLFKINWKKYNSSGDYYLKVNKMRDLGILRLSGNPRQLHSSFLIALLVIGILVSLFIFVMAWRSYVSRTYTPLITLIGYLFPFMFSGRANILWPLLYGFLIVLFGAAFSALALKSI